MIGFAKLVMSRGVWICSELCDGTTRLKPGGIAGLVGGDCRCCHLASRTHHKAPHHPQRHGLSAAQPSRPKPASRRTTVTCLPENTHPHPRSVHRIPML